MKILIADDHSIIRRGLKTLLESRFKFSDLTEVGDIHSLMEVIKSKTFTHMVLDMQLSDGNIVEVFEEIKRKLPHAKTLIYTMSPEDIFRKRMMELGADGFLSKSAGEEEVIRAFEIFLSGKKYMGPEKDGSEHQTGDGKSQNPFNKLSPKELLVVSYLLKGEGVKEISNRLDLKSNTIATFKARIFNKLGVSNLMDLRNLSDLYHVK